MYRVSQNFFGVYQTQNVRHLANFFGLVNFPKPVLALHLLGKLLVMYDCNEQDWQGVSSADGGRLDRGVQGGQGRRAAQADAVLHQRQWLQGKDHEPDAGDDDIT